MRTFTLLFLSVLCACGQLIGPRLTTGGSPVQRKAVSGRYNPAGKSTDGTPVDLLILPSGTVGTLLTTGLVSAFTLGGGSYNYVDDRTPSHTFLTNAVYSRRTPFNYNGALYSNNTHAILFNMTTALTPGGQNEGFLWQPVGIPTIIGMSATWTFKISLVGNHNFDMLHMQSTNYGVAQFQGVNDTYQFVTHSEPGTANAFSGFTTNHYYNLHSRMNAQKQRLEIILVDSVTGDVIGASSKPISDGYGGYGEFLYIKLQDYLWNGVDNAQLEISMIALNWTQKTFPLEPISVPAPTNLYLVQTDTNAVRLTWVGRGVTTLIERDSGSGYTTLTNEYSSPLGFGSGGRIFFDTNVTEGVTYQYRITSQIGDYTSASVASSSVTITNSHPGFPVVWQQETNDYQASATFNSQADFPMVEQRIKGINQATVQVSKVSFNFDNINEFTATNGEMLQVSFFTETNRGGVHLGTSRGTVMGTNAGYRDFVFFTPAQIPPGTNFWMALEGNWILCQMRLNLDQFGYLPDQGFDYLYHGSSLAGGVTNDLEFKLYIQYTPLPVSNVTTNQVADTAVTITWPDSNQGLVRYKVDQFHGSWTDDVTNTTATNVTITGLTIGETYKWRVYAYIAGQSGSESAKVESQLITLADLPIVTNTYVTSYTGVSEAATAGADEAGYRIVVGSEDIVLTQFGCWMRPGTYLDVGVYLKNSSCTVLASNTIPTLGKTDNAFNYVDPQATAITLTAGGTYYLTRSTGGFTSWSTGTMGTTSAGTATGGYHNDCTVFFGGNDQGGVNFRYYVP